MGLLQWSLQYQDGTVPTEHTPLTAEKREFLSKVMDEMMVDEPERLHIITNKMIQYVLDKELLIDDNQNNFKDLLRKNGASIDGESKGSEPIDESDFLDFLDECEDIVHQIDMANAFVDTYNGTEYLLIILENKQKPDCTITNSLEVRQKAATILGALAQNNEKVLSQWHSYSSPLVVARASSEPSASNNAMATGRGNVLDRLMSIYASFSHSSKASDYKLCSKVLYAITCLLSHVPFQEQIIGLTVGQQGTGESQHPCYNVPKLLLFGINSGCSPLIRRTLGLARKLLQVACPVVTAAAESMFAGARAAAPTPAAVGSTVFIREGEPSSANPSASSGPGVFQQPTMANLDASQCHAIVSLIAQIFVPTCLRHISARIEDDEAAASSGDGRALYDVDLCESSLHLLGDIVLSPGGAAHISAMSEAPKGTSGKVTSPVVAVLVEAISARKAHIDAKSEQAEQFAVEVELMKGVMRTVLTLR